MGLRTQPAVAAASECGPPPASVDGGPVTAWRSKESRASWSDVLATSRFCSPDDG